MVATLASLAFGNAAHAVMFTVGPDEACSHPTLATVMAALPSSGGMPNRQAIKPAGAEPGP